MLNLADGTPPRFARAVVSSWLLWPLVGLIAMGLGLMITRRPALPIAIILAAAVGYLVLQGNLQLLVPLATVGLVLGSSTLPGARYYFVAKFALMAAVAGTGAVVWVLRARAKPRVPVGFAVAFFGLIALAIVSTVYSVSPSATFSHAVTLLLVWMAVVIAVPLGMNTPVDVMDFLYRIGLVASITVVAGVVLSAVGIIDSGLGGRFRGLLINPNTIGYFIAPILPALVLMSTREENIPRRRTLAVCVAVLAVGLAFTGSRAGILASTVGIGAGLLAARRTGHVRQARRVVTFGLVGVLGVAGLLAVLDRPIRPGMAEGLISFGTGSNRIIIWSQALPVISQAALKGHGFATADSVVLATQHLPNGAVFGSVLNSYLETALDLGWPASIWLVLLGLSGIGAAWSIARRPGPLQGVGVLLIAGITGGMVEAIFESGLLAAGGLLAFHFWLLVAAAHSIRLRERFAEPSAPGLADDSLVRVGNRQSTSSP